jgi:hypothetical protein
VNKKYSNESKKIVAAAKGTNNLFFCDLLEDNYIIISFRVEGLPPVGDLNFVSVFNLWA